MSNRGVPLHMVLYPEADERIVIYCRGGVVRIFDRKTWHEQGAQGTPLLALTENEGAALAWFLKYWIGEQRLKPGDRLPGVEVQFED